MCTRSGIPCVSFKIINHLSVKREFLTSAWAIESLKFCSSALFLAFELKSR